MEVEITALITKTRARLYEVPIFHYGRAYEEARKSRRVMVSGLFGILYTNIVASHAVIRRQYIREANAFWHR